MAPRTRHLSALLFVAAPALLLTSNPARAQRGWFVEGSATGNLLVGSTSDFLDSGFGFEVALGRELIPALALRADAMLVGLEEGTTAPVGEPSGGSEAADNTIVILGVGPEVTIPASFVHIDVRGHVGAARNSQRRSNSLAPEEATWASAYGGGVGVRFDASPRVGLVLGGDILKLGELGFARTGGGGSVLREDPVILRLRVGLRFQ
ncbi:MAG: hypothetical protein RQ751_05500 [Longimicrobiales bacterium]|nr:hypothetical protein [Longimicrobiales bacterium]